jgi:hypothetical protein
MKKFFLSLLVLVNAQVALGDEASSFVFTGSESFKEVRLDKDIYRTQYRTESYQDTCYTQVQDGYRTECHTEYDRQCHTGPRTCSTQYETRCHQQPPVCHTETQQQCRNAPPSCRSVCHQGPQGQICREVCSPGGTVCSPVSRQVCHGGGQVCNQYPEQVCTGGNTVCNNVPRQVCNQVPNYRQEPYACTRTREVPYQVLDHKVEARVLFEFAGLPQGAIAREEFKMNINDTDVNVTVNTSKNLMIFATKTKDVVDSGNIKYVTIKLAVRFMDLKLIREAISGINDIEIKDDVLFFSVGKAIQGVGYKHRIKVYEHKFGQDRMVVDRNFSDDELESFVADGVQFFALNFKKVNAELKKKKFTITVSSEINLDGQTPLNTQDMPLLRASKTEEVKI